MNRKKIGIIIISLLVLCIIAGVVIKAVTKEPEPELVLTYAENQSEGYPTSMGAYYFADLVKERTNGRIQILVYPNGELGREADVITQMRYGGIDFARISLSQLAEFDERLNVLQMPYLYNDENHMWSVLNGEIGDDFLNQVNSIDLVGLSWYDAGARSFYTVNKQISEPKDMEGLKIRVQESELMMDMIECLNAEAVPLSYEEVYSALELGVIDGAENNWPSYEDTGHYRVATYLCEDEHTRIPEMQLCSIHTFQLLSETDKEIIIECAKESAAYEHEMWVLREKESKERALNGGVIITHLSANQKNHFREKMTPVYEKYCADSMDIIEKILEY